MLEALEAFQYTAMGVVIFGYFIALIVVVIIILDGGKLVDKVLNNEKSIKKDLFQDVEDRGIGYMGVLESLVKEIESYDDEILKACSLPSKTWEETKEEYIRYYTDDTFETYWLWIAISDLSNKLAENLKNL